MPNKEENEKEEYEFQKSLSEPEILAAYEFQEPLSNPAFEELKKFPNNFVVWGKGSKAPRQLNGHLAKSDDPTTWASYDECVACVNDNTWGAQGIGFMLTGTGIVFIDLDYCFYKNGQLKPWADKIVKFFGSYTERSPTRGKGLHILVKASNITKGCKRDIDKYSILMDAIEIYSWGRFCTLTGDHLEGTSDTIEMREVEKNKFLQEYFPGKTHTENNSSSSAEYELQDYDPNLAFPVDMLEALLKNSPEFKSRWEHTKKLPNDSSVSGYDLSIANYLVKMECSDSEIGAFLRAHREKYRNETKNPDKATELRYIAIQIGTARNGTEPPPDQDAPWPEIDPIDDKLLSVPPLPFDILPGAFRPWIQNIAHRTQCAPDGVAMFLFIIAGSIIGTKCGVKPKALDEWLLIANLWGALIGDPSTKKSMQTSECVKVLVRLEVESMEAYEEADKVYQADLMEFELKKKALEKELAKNITKPSGIDYVKNQLKDLEPPEKPVKRRYKTNDATEEKFGEMLKENPNGMLLCSDELTRLLSGWQKTGRESERAFFLEGWTGTEAHEVDRVGRGSIYIPNLCISIIGGIQPSRLINYLLKSVDGLDNDGMFQRFQLFVYPNEVAKFKYVDEKPDLEAKNHVYDIFWSLEHMDFKAFGAVQEEGEKFPYFRFSPEGQKIFVEFTTDLENDLRGKYKNDHHPIIAEHFGKYRSLMPILAFIYHCIEIASRIEKHLPPLEEKGISEENALNAAALCDDYLKPHALRIYGLVLNSTKKRALALLEKIKAGKLKEGFTCRDVYRKGWHLLADEKSASFAIKELVEAGYIRPIETEKTYGNKGKTQYFINPEILKNDDDAEENEEA